MTTENRGFIFRATPEALAELLQLPPGAYIDAVDSQIDDGIVRFRIRGAGPQIEPGRMLHTMSPTVHRTFGADGSELRMRITWPAGDDQK